MSVVEAAMAVQIFYFVMKIFSFFWFKKKKKIYYIFNNPEMTIGFII